MSAHACRQTHSRILGFLFNLRQRSPNTRRGSPGSLGLVGLGGFEPPSPPWKGGVTDRLDDSPIKYLLLRHHLFLSGLLPQATYPASQGGLIRNKPWYLVGSVVVERLNPCIRPLRATGLMSPCRHGCGRRNRTNGLQLMRLASYLCSIPQYYQSVLFVNQYAVILLTSGIAENALFTFV